MSCEARHRELVTRLLSLADVIQPTVDEVICVGIGRRYTRRGRQDNDNSRPVQLHADIREAWQIRGHADDSLPAWVGSLLDALHQAQGKGNRCASLTFLLLTGGWESVSPHFTPLDIPWLRKMTSMNIPLPPVWNERLRVRPTTVGGQHLKPWLRRYISMADMLEAIPRLDTVSSESARTVTPRQVMQVIGHGSMVPLPDRQRVLRALLEDAPGVSPLITQMREVAYYVVGLAYDILPILHGRATGGIGRSLAQLTMDTLLSVAQHWFQTETGSEIDLAVMCNPPPDILDKIVRHGYRGNSLSIPIFFHWWRTYGRHDACTQFSWRLVDAVVQQKKIERNVFAAMVAGTIMPPDGDRLLLRIDDTFSRDYDEWNALAAVATYIAACQATGHLPDIDGLPDRLQHAWGHQQNRVDGPTITPILAVGRERDLLLPVLMAARSTERWVPMILDCIDAASILDAVGGDSSGIQRVLADALTAGSDPVDPCIIVRLAASPVGQRLLPFLSNHTDIPPWAVMRKRSDPSQAAYEDMLDYRIAPHLVSPYWDTAPDPLRAWWQDATTQAPRWSFGTALLLYPTVMPQAAIAYPERDVLLHALAHPRWDTVPEADRRTVLDMAFHNRYFEDMIDLILRATTDAARQDVLAVAAMMYLSDAMMRILRLLATPTGQGDHTGYAPP